MSSVLRTLIPAVIAAAAVLPQALPAQAAPVNGAWITEFDRVMRNENGSVSGGEKARARLTLQQQGDSVTGTWVMLPQGADATPGTPRPLRGTIAGNKVSLTTEFQANVNINGEMSTRKISVVYDFTVAGDRREGTMTQRSSEMDMPPRPFSAWREK